MHLNVWTQCNMDYANWQNYCLALAGYFTLHTLKAFHKYYADDDLYCLDFSDSCSWNTWALYSIAVLIVYKHWKKCYVSCFYLMLNLASFQSHQNQVLISVLVAIPTSLSTKKNRNGDTVIFSITLIWG